MITTPDGVPFIGGNMDAYDEAAARTAIYPGSGTGSLGATVYAVCGLAGEAGEISGKLKKFMRGDLNPDQVAEAIVAECGDVLWYLSRVLAEFGSNLSECAQGNINKLASRSQRGVLMGDGYNH